MAEQPQAEAQAAASTSPESLSSASKAARNKTNLIVIVVIGLLLVGMLWMRGAQKPAAPKGRLQGVEEGHGVPKMDAADLTAGVVASNPEVAALTAAAEDESIERALKEGESFVPAAPEVVDAKGQIVEKPPEPQSAETDSQTETDEYGLPQEASRSRNRSNPEDEFVRTHGYSEQEWAYMNEQIERVRSRIATKSAGSTLGVIDFAKVSAEAGVSNGPSAADGASAPEEDPGMGIGAGTVWLASLRSTIDNYLPGPVSATLLSGPYRGAIVMGTSKVASNVYLQVTFDRMVYQGKSYALSAVAVRQSDNAPGLEADVDNRYFERIMLPFAAALVSSYAETAGKPEQTVVVSDSSTIVTEQPLTDRQRAEVAAGTGVKEGVVPVLRQQASQIQPHITLNKGEEIGVQLTEDL